MTHPAAMERALEFLPRIPNLRSAYSIYGNISQNDNDYNLQPDGDTSLPKEPPYTTCTSDWKGTLDYILLWGTWNVTDLLSIPPDSDVDGGIPNDDFPSDHISLVARLRWPLPESSTDERDA